MSITFKAEQTIKLNKENWHHVDFVLNGTWHLTVRVGETPPPSDDQMMWELGEAMRAAKVPRAANVLGHHGEWILKQVRSFYEQPEIQAEVARKQLELDRKILRDGLNIILKEMTSLVSRAIKYGATEEEIFNAVRLAVVERVMES